MSENLQKFLQKEEVVKTTLFDPSLYGGRFTREQFLLYTVIGVFLYTVIGIVFCMPPEEEMMRAPNSIVRFHQETMLLGLIFDTPVIIFYSLPLAIKRAHDIGHKGTFVTALVIMNLFARVLCVISYNSGIILIYLLLIPNFIYGLFLLFKDSEKGTNEYGTSIKYPDISEWDIPRASLSETNYEQQQTNFSEKQENSPEDTI